MSRLYYLLFIAILWAFPAYALKINLTKEEVVGDYSSIEGVVVFTEVKASRFNSANPTEVNLFNNLSFVLPDDDESEPIQFNSGVDEVNDDTNNFFYWEGLSASSEINVNGTYTITVSFKISANDRIGNEKKTIKDNLKKEDGSIRLWVYFLALKDDGKSYSDISNSTAKLEAKIEQLFAKPDAAPSDFAVTPNHLSLRVSWKSDEKATYTDGTTSKIPAKVLIMVFNEGESGLELDAKEVDNTNGENKAAKCTYTASEETCITCTDSEGKESTNTFVDLTQNNNGIYKFIDADNSGSYSVSGLDDKKSYTIALQYLEGVKRTVCVAKNPIRTYTWTELNGVKEAELGDPRCFIVSAAFGSPFAKHVSIFRWARDSFLLRFELGRQIVEFYYNTSEPFANYLKNSPNSSMVIRGMLYPVAGGLYLLKAGTNQPFFSLLIIFILSLGIWSSRIFWKRQRT